MDKDNFNNKKNGVITDENNRQINDIFLNLNSRRVLKNAKGKRLLEKTYLDYSLSLIELIKTYPSISDELLESLEITEKDFYDRLSGNIQENITFYDEALLKVNQIVKKKNLKME